MTTADQRPRHDKGVTAQPLNRPPTLVSLFAGIGGFDLGFARAGFQTVGMCEIDPHAQAVLTRHWPNVPLHDDVTTLEAATFGPADVVTFGSPCQDLSVAGKRAGLDGERSGLFLEAVRYIRDMLEETSGRSPRFAVWENVPGAFSSNDGHDFAAVLESLVGGEVRRPADGWANAGVAFGPLGSVEWRVLDSQHFGVAQRRRRVFVVYRPGGERAGEVLLERAGVPGHPPKGRAEGESATGGAEGGAGGGGRVVGGVPVWKRRGGFGYSQSHDVAPTLEAEGGSHTGAPQAVPMVPAVPIQDGRGLEKNQNGLGIGDGGDPSYTVDTTGAQAVAMPVAFKVRGGKEGGGKGYLGSEDKALTISTVQEQYLAEPVAFEPRYYSDRQGMGGAPDTRTGPLKATDGKAGDAAQHVAFVASDYSTGTYEPADKAEALTTSADRTRAAPIAFALRGREDGATPEVSGDRTNALRGAGGGSSRDYVAFAENSRAELRLEGGHGQVTGALSTGGGKPGQGTPTVVTPYAVRRLTPTECERLQGFPDDHTRYYPDGTEIADTHRYRMLGNAVTVSVVGWLAKRLAARLRAAASATLARQRAAAPVSPGH